MGLDQVIEPMSLPALAAAVRMATAVLFGGLIGLDREFRRGPAGIRTHMLVALAACVFTIVAFELLDTLADTTGNTGANPLHLIVAITSGVAFLAAGSIITSGGKVRGLTTGASMWLAGATGLACGSGHILLASFAVILSLVVLTLVRMLEVWAGIKDE